MNRGVLLSTLEVARQLALSDASIRRMLYRGEFPNAFKAGRAWKIPQADLEEYVENQRRERRTATTTSES